MVSIANECFDYQLKDRGFLFADLTLLHHDMFNGKDEAIISVAASMEILTLTADIVDDLQDQDINNAPWQTLDKAIVLNIVPGLLLLSKSMLDDAQKENIATVNHYYDDFVFKAINGQFSDLKNHVLTTSDYIHNIILKSASFVCLACLLGASLANSSQVSIVRQYAEKLGVMSQLKNDLRDLFKWEGKSDLLLKKKTLPIIYMLSLEEKSIIKSYYNGTITYKELLVRKNDAFNEIKHLGAVNFTRAMIELHRFEAIELITQLNVPNDYKQKIQAYF